MLKFGKKNPLLLLLGIILIHLVLLINLKFTAWPEMTLWPYLIIKSWLPYRDIAIAHTPLMLVKLAIFYKICGVGIMQLKIFTWMLILGADVLIYWFVNKIWYLKTALITVSAFTFWQLFFDGNGLWFDLFMGTLAFCSFYFVRQKKWIWAGIFWSLAFLSKQTAIWFLIPICLEIINVRPASEDSPIKRIIKFVEGVFIVLVPFTFILWFLGILPDFWNWAVKFGIFILPKAQGQIQLPDLKNLIVSVYPFLVFIPLIWKTGRKNVNLLVWAIAGSLGAYPRFEYFHFQPAIPYLALATGIFFSSNFLKEKLIKIFIVFYALGSVYLFGGFFMRNFKEGVRFYENDVQDIVSYVKSNTNPGDKIFVMNWWDNIYPLTNTLPAIDPWVPQLSWYMETPGIQEKMVSDLMSSKPKLIIFNPYSESGLSAYIPQKVYNYVTANYKLKEKIDNLEILIPR